MHDAHIAETSWLPRMMGRQTTRPRRVVPLSDVSRDSNLRVTSESLVRLHDFSKVGELDHPTDCRPQKTAQKHHRVPDRSDGHSAVKRSGQTLYDRNNSVCNGIAHGPFCAMLCAIY